MLELESIDLTPMMTEARLARHRNLILNLWMDGSVLSPQTGVLYTLHDHDLAHTCSRIGSVLRISCTRSHDGRFGSTVEMV